MTDDNLTASPTSESIRSALTTLEREHGVALSPAERLLLATDGTVTHMLEALTGREVSVAILDREVTGGRLHRTVALEYGPDDRPLVWARSTIRLSVLEPSVADELVDGDVGIGHLLRDGETETRREIVDVDVRPAGEFPPFVETDASRLLERTYRIYADRDRLMTITEYFPKDRLSRCRTR